MINDREMKGSIIQSFTRSILLKHIPMFHLLVACWLIVDQYYYHQQTFDNGEEGMKL
jgi:hypothetical protein